MKLKNSFTRASRGAPGLRFTSMYTPRARRIGAVAQAFSAGLRLISTCGQGKRLHTRPRVAEGRDRKANWVFPERIHDLPSRCVDRPVPAIVFAYYSLLKKCSRPGRAIVDIRMDGPVCPRSVHTCHAPRRGIVR